MVFSTLFTLHRSHITKCHGMYQSIMGWYYHGALDMHQCTKNVQEFHILFCSILFKINVWYKYNSAATTLGGIGMVMYNINISGLGRTDLLRCCCRASTETCYCQIHPQHAAVSM